MTVLIIEGLFPSTIAVGDQEGRYCRRCGSPFVLLPKGTRDRAIHFCSWACRDAHKQARDRAMKASMAQSLGAPLCRRCLKAPRGKTQFCDPCYQEAGWPALKQKALDTGVCFRCPNPTVPGRYMCKECLAVSQANLKRFREDFRTNPKYHAAKIRASKRRFKARYDKRRTLGVCIVCGGPNQFGPGRSPYCVAHKRK